MTEERLKEIEGRVRECDKAEDYIDSDLVYELIAEVRRLRESEQVLQALADMILARAVKATK